MAYWRSLVCVWPRPLALEYRYIRYADGSEELYHHANDPMEWKNVADDPAHANAKAKLARWLPEVNAPNAKVEEAAPARQGNRRRQNRRQQ